ncbi:hypothetical protein [Spirosoma aerophilum]
MNRAQKIALLTKVLQEGECQLNRQRLQQVVDSSPRSLILIDDLDFSTGQPLTDKDPVHFRDKSREYAMTLKEAHQYARQYGIHTLIVLPIKR